VCFTRLQGTTDVQFDIQTTSGNLANFQQAIKGVDYTEIITDNGDGTESVDIKFEFLTSDKKSLFVKVSGKLVAP